MSNAFLNRQCFSHKALLTLPLQESWGVICFDSGAGPRAAGLAAARDGAGGCSGHFPVRMHIGGAGGSSGRGVSELCCSAHHPCFVLQHLPEPAVSSGTRYVPVPSSYTTGEARVTLLILADLLHFQLSGSEKEAVDSEWVLPSHGELLAFTWFP